MPERNLACDTQIVPRPVAPTNRTTPEERPPLLNRVERALSAIVEGSVERLFAGRMPPARVARRLEAAMEDAILVDGHERLAPHYYRVEVAPRTLARMTADVDAVEQRLERRVEEAAAERGASLIEPATVHLVPNGALPGGALRIAVGFAVPEAADTIAAGAASAVGPGTGPAAGRTLVMAPGARPAGPWLTVARDGAADLGTRAEFRIGRGEDADLVLDDAAVSRHHAAIRRAGSGRVVFDLDSANGVYVNGRRAHFARLHDGDRLAIGSTELTYHDDSERVRGR